MVNGYRTKALVTVKQLPYCTYHMTDQLSLFGVLESIVILDFRADNSSEQD